MAAATVIRDHCLAPGRVDAPIAEGGRYGRMFDLPPLDADETLLHQLGAAGGFCDGYLAIDLDWAPTLPARAAPFRLADILVPVEAPARAAAPA